MLSFMSGWGNLSDSPTTQRQPVPTLLFTRAPSRMGSLTNVPRLYARTTTARVPPFHKTFIYPYTSCFPATYLPLRCFLAGSAHATMPRMDHLPRIHSPANSFFALAYAGCYAGKCSLTFNGSWSPSTLGGRQALQARTPRRTRLVRLYAFAGMPLPACTV